MTIHSQYRTIELKLKLSLFAFFLMTLCCLGTPIYAAQAKSPALESDPDVLIFTNGDKLTGRFERSDEASVLFKSDMAGEMTIDWDKVKEIHTNRQFAVIPKNVEIKKGEDTGNIPRGRLAVAKGNIELSRTPDAPPKSIPAADSAYIIDQKTFDEAVQNGPDLLHAWSGSVTLGTSLVEATQKSNNFSGGATLLRVTPGEAWLDRRDRTTLNFNFAYGKLTQPDTPDIKTDIYHLDTERDEYFTSRLFAFGRISYDHNFSQGLDLQQNYGAGIGWTVIKNQAEELDLRSSVGYFKQQFQQTADNQNLVGSGLSETYTRNFGHGVLMSEQGTVTPAWNNPDAYSASGQIGLTIPLYKRFSLSVTALHGFINNPPPGFRKNSFQLTTGLTYTAK